MSTIYNCEPSELVEKVSEELKKVDSIKAPEWAPIVKTGMHKERPPVDKDWWYVRMASVLLRVYKLGPIGVSKLRVKYGGKKNRGVKKSHFYKGSGNILRKIMQQLEKEEMVKTDLKSMHKGRLITAKGKKFLDEIAKKISAAEPKKEVKAEVKAPEVKIEKKTETKEKPAALPKESVKTEAPKKDEKPIQKATPKTQ